MKGHRFSTQVLLNFLFTILVAVMLCSCGSGGGGSSSSDSDNTTDKSGIQGTWGNGVSSVTFMSDKTYTVDANNSGTIDAWGTYSTLDNQLTMQDSGGTSSCFDTASQTFDTGRYTYSISGNTLTLTLISDNCSGRTTTLTEADWTGHSSSDKTPSTPTNLNATAATTSQINLSWTGSTDNIGVAGYKVFRNGTLITTTLDTVFSDTGLTANTLYTYTVSAYDASGNVSDKSSPDSATTNPNSTPTYSISGTVSGAVTSGVTIALSGTSSKSAATDSSGNYSFSGLANGSYTVTPSKTGYTFSPNNRSVIVNNANVTGQNFAVTANTSINNSKFYGYYSSTDGTLYMTIGGDVNLWGTDDYLYLPISANTFSYAGSDEKYGDYVDYISINNNVISATTEGTNGTTYYRFTFAVDFNSFFFERWGYSGAKSGTLYRQ
jgi:chitodextrinase